MERGLGSMEAEQKFSSEQEPREVSHTLLHFERHGDRAGEVLSDAGKKKLFDKGVERGDAAVTSVAFGSNYERAQHSAALDMAGAEMTPDVTGEETLEELRQKLDAARGKKVGSRIGTDPRLGFELGDEPYAKKVLEAWGKKKGLEFLVKESDELAKALGEKKGISYSGAAAGVASLVEKYIGVGEKFHVLLSDEEKRKMYGDTLERFMGSHGGVVDSFLCKVVEKTKGVKERDELVALLGDGAGFDTGEGIEVGITYDANSKVPEIRVSFTKKNPEGKVVYEFDDVVPMETLQEIIAEGDLLKDA